MGLFDFFNRLDTKTNNGLNLIHDKKTKNLLYAFNKKNGRIDGLVQVFYSVSSSGHNPHYKLTSVGFVRQEYLFIDGFPNGYFKEFDSKGNLSYHIDNIKSNTFDFILNFSLNFLKPRLLFSDKYQINGFVNEYYANGTLSAEKKVLENKLISNKSYYQNGQLNYDSIESKEYYSNGQLKRDYNSGLEYYDNGQLKSDINVGKVCKEYFVNGQLKKDSRSGVEYYDNGQLKSDIKGGKEYYINGSIKIDNIIGKEYYVLNDLNTDIFNGVFSFKDILNTNFLLINKLINDYYTNITLYKNDGSYCNFDEIKVFVLEDLEKPNVSNQSSLGINDASRLSRTIRHKELLESKYSNPILINDFCFRFGECIYGYINISNIYNNGEIYYDNKFTELSLFPYTGWHNNVYYNSGINSES